MKVLHHIPTIGTDAFFHNVDIRMVNELVSTATTVGAHQVKQPDRGIVQQEQAERSLWE